MKKNIYMILITSALLSINLTAIAGHPLFKEYSGLTSNLHDPVNIKSTTLYETLDLGDGTSVQLPYTVITLRARFNIDRSLRTNEVLYIQNNAGGGFSIIAKDQNFNIFMCSMDSTSPIYTDALRIVHNLRDHTEILVDRRDNTCISMIAVYNAINKP